MIGNNNYSGVVQYSFSQKKREYNNHKKEMLHYVTFIFLLIFHSDVPRKFSYINSKVLRDESPLETKEANYFLGN